MLRVCAVSSPYPPFKDDERHVLEPGMTPPSGEFLEWKPQNEASSVGFQELFYIAQTAVKRQLV